MWAVDLAGGEDGFFWNSVARVCSDLDRGGNRNGSRRSGREASSLATHGHSVLGDVVLCGE